MTRKKSLRIAEEKRVSRETVNQPNFYFGPVKRRKRLVVDKIGTCAANANRVVSVTFHIFVS